MFDPPDIWTDLSEQLRLVSSLALNREVEPDEDLSKVNEELHLKLKQELIIKEAGLRARDNLHG